MSELKSIVEYYAHVRYDIVFPDRHASFMNCLTIDIMSLEFHPIRWNRLLDSIDIQFIIKAFLEIKWFSEDPINRRGRHSQTATR